MVIEVSAMLVAKMTFRKCGGGLLKISFCPAVGINEWRGYIKELCRLNFPFPLKAVFTLDKIITVVEFHKEAGNVQEIFVYSKVFLTS